MFAPHRRWLLILTVATAVWLWPLTARAQQPGAAPAHAVAKEIMRRDVVDMPGKELLVETVEYPPGVSSAPHRHDAQVVVYVLQGRVVMQVKGGPRMNLGPGETFYEGPSDIHSVSGNASSSKPATIVVFMIKDKGKPTTRPVPPDEAQ
jgi:quercetin dioxygenase-like cupin family protein